MLRKISLLGTLALLVALVGCSDDSARQKVASQAKLIESLKEDIAALRKRVGTLETKLAQSREKNESIDDWKRQIEEEQTSLKQELLLKQQAELQNLVAKVEEMNKLIEARAKQDEAINKKLEEGMLYQQNLKPEMERYLKEKLEPMVQKTIENQLKDVFPYAFSAKRY